MSEVSRPVSDIQTIVKPLVQPFFHKATNTVCYLVSCPATKKAIVFDTVLDYDPISHQTSTEHIDLVSNYIHENELDLVYIIDTHVHADHLTGSKIFKERFPRAHNCIGYNVVIIQEAFKKILNLEDLKTDGSQFDLLIRDNDHLTVGSLTLRAIYTPGHTPACMTYVIGDAVFTGDTIFMPDFGTARCDFPGGSAETLFDSAQKLFELNEDFRLFVGHDYGTDGREVAWETTIGDEKRGNTHLNTSTSKESFVKWRQERDATLQLPRLIMQSLQVNLRAGNMPEPEENGVSYFKLPVNPKFN